MRQNNDIFYKSIIVIAKLGQHVWK